MAHALSDLDYGAEEEAAVLRVLRSKWLSMGPEVQAFEQEFSGFLGVRHAFAVANGTAALHLACLALGLGPGDEVIQPAINFVASANMTVAVGATPVFGDIVSLTEPTIAPEEIEQRITPHTKAVIVMHYGGYPCRMNEIRAICQRHGLAAIEDACHAVGASQEDRPVGRLGDVACFSFFSNKNLATGEGGMVVTDRDDLAERFRRLRSHGMTTLTWDRHRGHASSYDVTLHGYNYRLDELHAALGRAQLQKVEQNNRLRQERAATYRRQLDGWNGWRVVFADHPGRNAYHLMVALAPNASHRQQVVQSLKENGIQTSLHYPCVPDFTGFAQFRPPGLERSREFPTRAVTLPLYPLLTDSQVEEVCAVIRQSAG